MGVGPAAALVIDIDSTICEVIGKHKQGAGYGYTRKLGYDPLVATRADTGKVLHARIRKGSANTQRGARRFIDELVARVRRAGAGGGLTIRFDSGFWANDTIAVLNRLDVRYTMAVRCSSKGINNAITAIPDEAWTPIAYTDDGEAEGAYTTGVGNKAEMHRLVVRRTRLTDKGAVEVAARLATPRVPHRSRRHHRRHRQVPPAATAPGSSTSRPETSTPTRPGCNAPSSPTT